LYRDGVHERVRLQGGVRLSAAIAASLGLLLIAAGQAVADQPAYAPLDQPGPPLSVSAAQLEASLKCSPGVANATRAPVLLNPATGVTPDQNYSWNWEPALSNLGIPWCAYTAPHNTLDDIQTSGEYLVYNIRKMYAMAGRRIAIIGHSQGGMSMRWPFRFWPDTRGMVDDVIAFSGPNHGTTQRSACSSCPPAIWQQYDSSKFVAALNSGTETFAGISYTEVHTHTDEVVQPANDNQHASAALHSGAGQITNVATQDICPLDTQEHNQLGTSDPVAYALGIDALDHPGPANPARIPASTCAQPSMPGINPADANTWAQIAQSGPGLLAVATPVNLVGAPMASEEPPLKCYVFANCRGARAATLRASVRPRRPRPGRRRFRIRVLVNAGSRMVPVQGARVKFGRKLLRKKTNAKGKLTVRRRVKAGHRYPIVVSHQGMNSATLRVHARHRR
jgi:hypothetical protein